MRHASSKLKAAFIGPCIGVGGADALMSSLVRHTQNIEWVGAAACCELSVPMISWAVKGWDADRCPLHVCGPNNVRYKGLKNHESYNEAIYHACKKANIIISWCFADLKNHVNLLDIPVIEYAQNSDAYAKKIVEDNKYHTHYKAACSHAAAKVFGDSANGVDDVSVIYNGIDPARVSPRKGRKKQRESWGLSEERKIVLFMGRFVKEKHPLDLIKAISELPQEYVGVFAGHGYEEEPLFEAAQAMAPGRIAFVDPVYHVGDLLAAADCFVLPSDFEGHPLALMEAMLAGVPCVYTDLPVMQELHAKHGEMGLMIPRGAPLAPAVREVTEKDHHRVRVARTVVWDEYTIAHIAAQWEEYLHICLNDWWQRRYLTEIKPVSARKPMVGVKDI